MSITPKRLVPGSVLAAAAAAQYTAGALTRAVVKSAQLTNTTAGAVACNVHVVPAGGAAGAATTVISAKSLAPGETYLCPELAGQVIEPGGSLQASGAGVTLSASGVEIV